MIGVLCVPIKAMNHHENRYLNVMYLICLQVFFVIRLHSAQAAANLPPIHDPDALIQCKLMDGRDAFLTLAREKHYEFSSLRRCQFSTMALLYELHNLGKENFVYLCNNCQAQVETRWHCTVCEVRLWSCSHCDFMNTGSVGLNTLLEKNKVWCKTQPHLKDNQINSMY